MGYYDELEVCNHLGSNVKKHKLGLIFFTLTNLNPRYRSNFKGIFLLTVANVTVIEEHGIDKVLEPLVDDLKFLATTGMSFNEGVVHAALLAFLADNLASHCIGGFKESMSFARHFCRSCLTNKEASYRFFTEEQFTLRTPDSHHCLEIENDPSLSVTYGINRNSILNTVPGFSVAEGLPQDIMHDLLGVLNYQLKLFIKHCIRSKYFTLHQLNEKIKSFDYGYTLSNRKPPPLNPRFQEDLKIRYSASEMLTMASILPYIIGQIIPDCDVHYHCLLLVIKILSICLAPVVTDNVVAYLRVLIEEHHQLFREIYKDESFIPKLHYMVHYPNQIVRHGPLVRSWTM